jgi:quinol monooxygenase YgiN
MITVTADFDVAAEDERRAEQLLASLAAAVASELGNVCYHILKVRQSPPKYRVYEMYESSAAFDAHKASDHLRTIFPEFRKLLTAAPVVTQYDLIARA